MIPVPLRVRLIALLVRLAHRVDPLLYLLHRFHLLPAHLLEVLPRLSHLESQARAHRLDLAKEFLASRSRSLAAVRHRDRAARAARIRSQERVLSRSLHSRGHESCCRSILRNRARWSRHRHRSRLH